MSFVNRAKMISMCTRVFSQLKLGFSEGVYRNALAAELQNAAAVKRVTMNRAFPIHYGIGYGEGKWVDLVQVGTCYADIEVISESGELCILELNCNAKSIVSNSNAAVDSRNQLEKYVRLSKSTGIVPTNAFLINFPKRGENVEVLEYNVSGMNWVIQPMNR